ncbi:MAG: hypothetical protein JWO48_1495 [Bryobacterales bacterium]|nr:hypothetical protein [Bryobacterales bacterium]
MQLGISVYGQFSTRFWWQFQRKADTSDPLSGLWAKPARYIRSAVNQIPNKNEQCDQNYDCDRHADPPQDVRLAL